MIEEPTSPAEQASAADAARKEGEAKPKEQSKDMPMTPHVLPKPQKKE